MTDTLLPNGIKDGGGDSSYFRKVTFDYVFSPFVPFSSVLPTVYFMPKIPVNSILKSHCSKRQRPMYTVVILTKTTVTIYFIYFFNKYKIAKAESCIKTTTKHTNGEL